MLCVKISSSVYTTCWVASWWQFKERQLDCPYLDCNQRNNTSMPLLARICERTVSACKRMSIKTVLLLIFLPLYISRQVGAYGSGPGPSFYWCVTIVCFFFFERVLGQQLCSKASDYGFYRVMRVQLSMSKAQISYNFIDRSCLHPSHMCLFSCSTLLWDRIQTAGTSA